MKEELKHLSKLDNIEIRHAKVIEHGKLSNQKKLSLYLKELKIYGYANRMIDENQYFTARDYEEAWEDLKKQLKDLNKEID